MLRVKFAIFIRYSKIKPNSEVNMKKESSHTKNDLMEKITSLCKRRGFVFPSSEIYGGVGGFWDFGPNGVLLKNNIKQLWWKRFVQIIDDITGIEGSIIMNPEVWKASGHIESFTDPLVECKNCHSRYRADHMLDGRFVGEGKATKKNQCPTCGETVFTEPRNFNMMFKTHIGPVEDSSSETYLRPETAQSMFTDFKQVAEISRKKIPFGIAQIGKAFRNEITFGNFFFRSREFEQMEIEYFVKPGTDEKWFGYWLKEWKKFIIDLGINKNKLREYEHPKKSLSHYSKRTVDIEYDFPFGWSELTGTANRTDYDLKQHEKFSGKDLTYFEEEGMKRYHPYVIEPTMGVDRMMLAAIVDAYDENESGEVFLRLDPKIAPIKVAVFPLVNKEKLPAIAKDIYNELKQYWFVQYDDGGSVGRRYRRQDEIGTPFCVTVDFESQKKNTVTVRRRDTMKQERVKIKDLACYFMDKI